MRPFHLFFALFTLMILGCANNETRHVSPIKEIVVNPEYEEVSKDIRNGWNNGNPSQQWINTYCRENNEKWNPISFLEMGYGVSYLQAIEELGSGVEIIWDKLPESKASVRLYDKTVIYGGLLGHKFWLNFKDDKLVEKHIYPPS